MREFTVDARGAVSVVAMALLVAVSAGCTSGKESSGRRPVVPTYSISGTVAGAVAAGVSVQVQGSGARATTDALGRYTIYGLSDGTYTLEATRAGYTFTPPTRTLTVSGADVPNQDFTSAQGVSISGTVSGDGKQGVTVTLAGPEPSTATTTATTDASGAYRFWNVAAGVYRVTPLAPGWNFSPGNAAVTVAGASLTGPDFVSLPLTFSLEGRVTGAFSAGVTVTLSGAGSGVAVTDGSGSYTFGRLVPGSYTITPSYPGARFTPAQRTATITNASRAGQNFVAAATHAISGRISGDVLEGVTVSLSGAATADTTTDVSGYFEFPGLADGGYVLTASLDGYTFSPAERTVTLSRANATGANFTATATVAPTYTVSGTAGVHGATVTLQGDPSSATSLLVATAGAAGAFSFRGVDPGEYLVIPTHDDYTFDPASRFVVVAAADVTGLAFTATVSPTARTIAGNVAGVVTAGVTVTLTGPSSPTTTTDADGNFAFRGLASGTYLATPSLSGFVFSPADCLVSLDGPSVTFVQFTSAHGRYAISGTVTGPTAAGVTVTLAGAADRTTTTAGDGTYSFTNLPNGEYSVTPSLADSYFSPEAASITIEGANAVGVDFVSALSHVVSGQVTAGGLALAGVKVTLTGASTAEATTDVTGAYVLPGLRDGGYVLTPSLSGYAFEPVLLPVDVAGADVSDADFVATLIPTYSASGTMTGVGYAAVPMHLSGAATATVNTDAGGAYTFTGLPDGSYMVIPAGAGTYTPASRAFRIDGANVTAQDFVAGP